MSLPNNFYLASGRTINLSGFKNALGSQIGITTAAIPTIGSSVSIYPSKAVAVHQEYFFSDDEKYEIDYLNNAIVLKVKGQTQSQETLSVEESQRLYKEWQLYQEQTKSQEQNTQTDDATKNKPDNSENSGNITN